MKCYWFISVVAIKGQRIGWAEKANLLPAYVLGVGCARVINAKTEMGTQTIVTKGVQKEDSNIPCDRTWYGAIKHLHMKHI